MTDEQLWAKYRSWCDAMINGIIENHHETLPAESRDPLPASPGELLEAMTPHADFNWGLHNDTDEVNK
jgi:hypothetical protein